MRSRILLFFFLIIFLSCGKPTTASLGVTDPVQTKAKFTLLSPEQSGITFSNFTKDFKENYDYNIFRYEYLYNGGGIAAGDVNGDSLPDLYFTSSFSSNKLYLNLGDFKFMDVTELSGTAAMTGFKTGTTMADINGDGKLDIYCCRTGKSDDGLKTNHTFINLGNKIVNGIAVPFFEDQSKQLGLDDNSNSTHACFFDFDRDGDLDLFLLNHRVDFTESTNFRLHPEPDGSVSRITTPSTPFESNRLYQNNMGHFTDITTKAGMLSSAYGLSVTPCDLNRDGWMDLYVADDYIEPDRIYINNKNGTFTDHYAEYLKHSSLNSMGSDIADINNDGLDDIMVLDMKTDDPVRYKTLINGMHYDRYNLLLEYGYGRQVGRNVLQLNNGNNTFSEIGQYAGVSATDWSWGSLIADLDNDGWKDIFITNGYRRDVANLDYLNYVRDSLNQTGGISSKRFPDITVLLNYLPEKKTSNYLFINNTHLGFENEAQIAGIDQPAFSNGCALADLDRDGDLDLIVNNLTEPAFIYRNDVQNQNWIQIDPHENNGNTNGLGTTVDIYAGQQHQHQSVLTNKGFLSASEPVLQFGLGEFKSIDSIILQWPEGEVEIMRSVQVNQRIQWTKGDHEKYTKHPGPVRDSLFRRMNVLPSWKHQENIFVDFKREILLPYMISAEGPCMAVGDVNGDHLEDFYMGNSTGYPKALFLQKKNNSFVNSDNLVFKNDSLYEDCGAVFKDMDGDGDLDLVVVSGGSSFPMNDPAYMSRYYTNDGKANFSRVMDFPIIRTNAGAVLAIDFDHDQDTDLIICGRSTPGRYPESPRSYLLQNNQGKFKDVTHEVFPDLEKLGMITDLKSADLDGDHEEEIVFAGEWMPLTIYSYDGKVFRNKTSVYGLSETTGWWKSITLVDMDNDGDVDLWAGNNGLNTRYSTSPEHPITLITKDFDGNGSLDPVMCFYFNDKLYPFAERDDILGQIPRLKKKFNRYAIYANATINDIFTEEELAGSTKMTINSLETMYLVNENKKFTRHPLPYQVQFAPVNDMITEDFNHDGSTDILMGGNFLYSDTETGEMDAGNGTLLLQNADHTFRYVPNTEHGFWAQGEVRDLTLITLADGQRGILIGNNQGPVQLYKIIHDINQ